MLTEMDRAPLLERSLQIRGIVRPTEHLPRGNRTIPCCPGLARVMESPFLRFLRRRIGERLPIWGVILEKIRNEQKIVSLVGIFFY